MSILSNVVLCGSVILVLTDVFAIRLNCHAAMRFRWSLPWHMLRYTSILSAVALALLASR